MNAITISINEMGNGESYIYHIYLDKEVDDIEDDTEEDEGGEYTGSDIEGAIEMASSHTIRLLEDIKNSAI